MLENDPDAVEITVEEMELFEDKYMLKGDIYDPIVQLIRNSVPEEIQSEEYEGEVVARIKPASVTADSIPGFVCEVYV